MVYKVIICDYRVHMKDAGQFKKIQESVKKHNIMWSFHASQRMIERQISSTGVIDVLLHGEIIEEYDTNMIVFGWYNNKPIHVICFFKEDEDCVFITSVYNPDLDHYESDYKTRRK